MVFPIVGCFTPTDSGIVTAGFHLCSQRLVSGESLMNDGTAIVVFVLMLKAQ